MNADRWRMWALTAIGALLLALGVHSLYAVSYTHLTLPTILLV